MMKVLSIIFVLAFFVNGICAKDFDWRGIYTFDEETKDPDGNWSSRWFRLEVKKDGSKLIGFYTDGENSKTLQNFSLKVVTTKDSAVFYFDHYLTSKDLPASRKGEFRKGDPVFKLKTVFDRDRKPFVATFWGRINLAARSEGGGNRKDNIFFKKS